MDKRLKIVFWVIILLVPISLLGCSNGKAEQFDETNLRIESAWDHLSIAEDLANQWSEDAQLIDVKAYISPKSSIKVSFLFESPSIKDKSFRVNCWSGTCSGNDFFVPFTWLASGWQSINMSNDMLDSAEVAITAIQNGGSEFMEASNSIIWIQLGRDKSRDTGDIV